MIVPSLAAFLYAFDKYKHVISKLYFWDILILNCSNINDYLCVCVGWVCGCVWAEACRWPGRAPCLAPSTCAGWKRCPKTFLRCCWSEETTRVSSPSTHNTHTNTGMVCVTVYLFHIYICTETETWSDSRFLKGSSRRVICSH